MTTVEPPQTPQLPSASLIKRLLAFLYDLFILSALSMGYSAIVTMTMALLAKQKSDAYMPMHEGYWFGIGWLLMIVGFYYFFWKKAGQTVGMRAWRLKILSARGQEHVTNKQWLIRIAIAPLSLCLGGLGYLWCLFNKDKAAWQDLASGTRVVHYPKENKKKPS